MATLVKKSIFATAFAIVLLLVADKQIFAQCNTFDFPSVQSGNVLFYNCDFGEIQKFDAQNKISPVPNTENFGGFVHNFIWSPDTSKALVLAENISATVQNLDFYSSEREYDSLNWWMYDFETGKTVLLDKNIISIGWGSSSEVIYNWNNKDLSGAKINDSGLSDYSKLADISGDENNISTIVSPASLDDTLIFPMQKGFYGINLNRKETKHYSLASGIKKLLPNTFSKNYFIIESGNSLYQFTASEEALDVVNTNFSAADFSFLAGDSLAVVGTDGKVYSYNLDTKTKTFIQPNISGNVSRVFSTEKENEFLFVIGKNIYRKSIKDNSTTLLGQDWNSSGEHPLSATQTIQPSGGNTSNLIPVEQKQATPSYDTKFKSIALYIIIFVALVAVIIIVYLIYTRKKKND